MGRREAFAYGLIVAALVCFPAVTCFARGAVNDPDVWWHLKAGEWIFGHRAWPVADAFSSWGSGRPWAAYSWLPELMLFGLHQALGLRGLALFTAAVSVAIVAALFAMLRRLNPNTTLAVGLTLVGGLGLLSLESPRPWLLSILCFVIELDLLLTAGRTGNRRLLLWLVPLFALWANMHIQFVFGLAVLGAAVAEVVLARVLPEHWFHEDSRRIGPGWMTGIFALSAAATLLNPYHYHLYQVALELLGQSKLWNVIQELRAMAFRSVSDWTVLAVTVAAAFALGWRRRPRLLLLILLVVGAWFAFRSRRDGWIVLVVGLAVLADAAPGLGAARLAVPRWIRGAVAAAVTLALAAGTLLVSESRLQEKVAAKFPVEAARFLHDHGCGGRLFNPFHWGGYLIYYLPEVPVSMDGRTMVHGQERVLRHARTLRGSPKWREDQELAKADVVLVPAESVLAELLRLDSRYLLVYEDPVAIVFRAGRVKIAKNVPK